MASSWLSALVGAGSALNAYQNATNAREDRTMLRDTRMQELANLSTAGEAQKIKNEQAQRAIADQDSIRQAARDALKPPVTQMAGQAVQADTAARQSPFASGEGAPGQSAATSQNTAQTDNQQPVPPANGATRPGKSPMTLDEMAQLDKSKGLPLGTTYGVMKAESNFNPDAVSPKGAIGAFQVMPATAKDPGYGLQSFDPKDPNGAMGYFAKLYQKTGGDISRAAGAWNAGLGGDFDNPETKAFVPRVLQGAQEFQMMYGLKQADAKPAPAQVVAAAEQSGVTPPASGIQSALGAQQKMMQQAISTARNLEAQGKPDLAQQFYAKAADLQTGAMDLQAKSLTAQKSANAEVERLASGVTDQASYNNLQSNLAQNPTMAEAIRGLDLTGDYEQDKNKLTTLADRTLTLKDQAAIQNQRVQTGLDIRKQQMAEAQAQAPKVAEAQRIAQDENRKVAAADVGVPFVPTPLSSGDTKVDEEVMKQTFTKNQEKLTSVAKTQEAAAQSIGTLTQLAGLLSKSTPVSTGGIAALFGGGANVQTLTETDRQIFDKLSNDLVLSLQRQAMEAGGGRSSATAAMANIIASTKPNLNMGVAANKRIVENMFVAAQSDIAHANFMREFHEVNPNVPLTEADGRWAVYQQSLGPEFTIDPANPVAGSWVNLNRSPVLLNGAPNPQYQSYKDFFRPAPKTR